MGIQLGAIHFDANEYDTGASCVDATNTATMSNLEGTWQIDVAAVDVACHWIEFLSGPGDEASGIDSPVRAE
jgi:hypothetical protein